MKETRIITDEMKRRTKLIAMLKVKLNDPKISYGFAARIRNRINHNLRLPRE